MRSIPGTITEYTQDVDQLDTLDKTPDEILEIRKAAAERRTKAIRAKNIASALERGTITAEEASEAIAEVLS